MRVLADCFWSGGSKKAPMSFYLVVGMSIGSIEYYREDFICGTYSEKHGPHPSTTSLTDSAVTKA